MSMGYQNGGNDGQVNAQQNAENADWDTLKDDVGGIAGAAVDRGRHFIEAAREQATGYMDRRKDEVAGSVADLATSLRESTQSFEDRPNIQAVVDGAAEGLEQLADTIRARSFDDIFNEVEEAIRRRPTAVAAVTLTAGFFLARFIKASADGLRDSYDAKQRAGGGPQPNRRAGRGRRNATGQESASKSSA